MSSFFTMLFTTMMLFFSISSLSLSINTREKPAPVQILFLTIYFVFMLAIITVILAALIGITFHVLKNDCNEVHIRCTGEEYLMIQGIDLSSWGFWENHLALACIMIILLTITYVQLLQVKTLEVLRLRGRNFLQLFN